VLDEPGFKVLHIQDLDFNSTCLTFVGCLEEVEAWSAANRGHLPVAILVELKDAELPVPGFVVPVPIGAPELDALDAEIRSVFSEEQIITPDDVRGSHPTLEAAVLAGGWPTLRRPPEGAVPHGQRGWLPRPLPGRSALARRPGPVHQRHARLARRGVREGERVDRQRRGHPAARRRRLRRPHEVRRPDVEARSGDTTRRDAALASGAQWVSTDYPVPGSSPFSSYFAAIPGGEPARCNPVNTGPRCSDALLEGGTGSSRSAVRGRGATGPPG
jgi:hypothetical protein